PAYLAPPENFSRPLEVLGRVDAERYARDDARVDAHARLERAQLLELLALLQRRRGERDETRQRGAAKGVKPDVVIERALARGRPGAREIERAQAVLSDRRADELHHVRVAALLFARDLGRKRGDIDRRVCERGDRGCDVGRRDGGQIGLHVDDDTAAALRVDDLERLEDAVRSRNM